MGNMPAQQRYLGPYDIISQVGPPSWTLQLLASMHAVHLVFHVSMLEPSTPNSIPNHIQPPPPPITVDEELEYKISDILDSKLDKWWVCKLLYLVYWSGYKGTDEETSWLLANELGHASEIFSEYHLQYPNRPGPLWFFNLYSSVIFLIYISIKDSKEKSQFYK